MSSEDLDPADGRVPFADQRFDRDEMVEVSPPGELAQLLEREIAANKVVLSVEDFVEVSCVSKEFATAVFMLRREPGGGLKMLAPAGAARKPN